MNNFSTLVMSIFNNKGVYAFLLGSGVSLEAKIMSGWKVTEDLVKKLAVAKGKNLPEDAFAWYKEEYGCEAEYSKLLEQLGRRPSEMEALLRPYFEPNEEDKELGYKKPTAAHKAIAEMAQRGYLKLLITTNFDRLMESALDEIGVEYQVICHESEISSRVPLYHFPLTILKVNGDYKDCRFRNTERELSEYPVEMVSYLDSVLKNFGLVSCGWSAIWDKALVSQIIENKEHRYSYYFTYVGDSGKEIESLAKGCKGESFRIDGADTFFEEINERLKAMEMIEGMNRKVDSDVAVARVKGYMSDPKGLIRYTDLFESMTTQLLSEVKDMVYGQEYPSASFYEKVLSENIAALGNLLPMSLVAVRWSENEHNEAIVESLSRVANRKIDRHTVFIEKTDKLNHVLDTVYLYGLGVACIFYKKYSLLDSLLRVKFFEYERFFSPYIIDQDNCWLVDSDVWNTTTNYQSLKSPFSTTVSRLMKPYFSMIQNDKEYIATVCIFEKVLSMYYYLLINKALSIEYYPPIGMFRWQPIYIERNRKSSFSEFFESIEQEGENSRILQGGLFGGDFDKYKEAYDKVTEIAKKIQYV